MVTHSTTFCLTAICLFATGLSTPTPQTVGSGITILTHNDLFGSQSFRTESLLVLSSPLDLATGREACASLGESLWAASTADFLPYLEHVQPDLQYWTEAKTNGSCVSFNVSGEATAGHCHNEDKLPVLCTNSAPYTSSTVKDNSTYWQVQIQVDEKQWLTGFRDKVSFRFEGVRYAAKPQRFSHSAPDRSETNETALSFGSQCTQSGNVGSEDCLFLNIWTPSLPSSTEDSVSALKPVMVQIHGGAFTGGTGNDPTYDGGALASRGDVVVVAINYRLATLGFLALEDGSTNGNYGLGDQVTALEWVQTKIKAFGGDPSRITILGQSAGAASVRALLASPKATGKFSAAILQSNLGGYAYATTYSEYYDIPNEYSVAAVPILNATGCLNARSQVECLRGIDPYVLANLSTVARYIVQDGDYITSDKLQLTGSGNTANVPVMLGFMRDDGASFVNYPEGNETAKGVLDAAGLSNETSLLDTDLYPISLSPNQTTNAYNTSAALATDAEFRCLDLATAYSASRHQVFPSVYVYQFNRSYDGYDPNPPVCSAPPEEGYLNGNPNAEYFKCHSGELAYVFGTVSFLGKPDRDGSDIPMSQFVLDSWASFARTQNPNPATDFLNARGFTNTSAVQESSGYWAPFTPDNLKLQVFQYPSYQAEYDIFSSSERCNSLRLPLRYYEG